MSAINKSDKSLESLEKIAQGAGFLEKFSNMQFQKLRKANNGAK